MDEFIKAFSNFSNELLPILKAICLVCLVLLLIKLIKLLGSVDKTVLKTHNTIDLVDQSVEKLQAPLDTVAKVSRSVDKAHDATVKFAEDTKEFFVNNADNIKEKVSNLLGKTKKEEIMEKEPSPEDIIAIR